MWPAEARIALLEERCPAISELPASALFPYNGSATMRLLKSVLHAKFPFLSSVLSIRSLDDYGKVYQTPEYKALISVFSSNVWQTIPTFRRRREYNEVLPVMEAEYCNAPCSAADVLHFSSNPALSKAAMQLGLRLLTVEREYLEIHKVLKNLTVHARFHATLDYMAACVSARTKGPLVVFFSGHTFLDEPLFEDDAGKMSLDDIEAVKTMFAADADCYVLSCCKTDVFGRKIVDSFQSGSRKPFIIVFRSLIEDDAGTMFMSGIFHFLNERASELKAADTDHKKELFLQMFKTAVDHMKNNGFATGDPESYLHPPGHPHMYKPDLKCNGCTPPVYGLPAFWNWRTGNWEDATPAMQ
jgi:hypothetical protein